MLYIAAVHGAPSATAAVAQTRPNVVVLLVDDMGYADLGCYGHEVHRTPHIDALAADGVRFTNAYANAPNCAPSRASLLTGQYPPRHGIYTVGSPARGRAADRRLVPPPNRTALRDEERTLAEGLAGRGYRTACIGKWHLGADPASQGFEHCVAGNEAGHPRSYFSGYDNPDLPDGPEGEYLTDRLTDEAVAFIDSTAREPFFLLLSYFAVHTPVQGRADLVASYRERYRGRGANGLRRRAEYAAMVGAVDESVGRVLDALRRHEIADRTIVVLLSDNGGHGGFTTMAPLRGSKGMLYEGGIRVPMIARWPGVTRAGLVEDTPVMALDWTATLSAAAGVPADADRPLDGVDLRGLLTGEAALQPRALHWHFPAYLEAYSARGGPWRTTPAAAVRIGRFKAIEFFEDQRLELYDLRDDPGETRDLAASSPERAAAMRTTLEEWRAATGAAMPTSH